MTQASASRSYVLRLALRLVALSSCLLGLAQAQSGKPLSRSASNVAPVPADRVVPIDLLDLVEFPPLDLAAVRAVDELREQAGEPPRYAISREVSIDPNERGLWETADSETLVWRLRVRAAGAQSINLGFTRCRLPAESRLLIYDAHDPSRAIRPFTRADNDAHGQLWTPPITTDDLVVELLVDMKQVGEVELELGHVGQGYRAFVAPVLRPGPASGSCNVDVVCPEGDDWRNEIGAVAAISTGGAIFCTGFLVNNTGADGTPYFMTANHCGVSSGNAASLVVFWNFENSACRPVGASGGAGDGTLTEFNTGSIWRAGYGPSDFTLVELDDLPDPGWGVTFAGWDRSSVDPLGAIGIHHPDGEEKRISFENDPLATTAYLGGTSPADGTHLRILDWDLGTTEPGSSGSPLFSPEHRVIGQLHGGYAACGNDLEDWYGRFSVSWTGGGAASSRLSDWLDPGATGAVTVDTLGGVDFRVTPSEALVSSGLKGGPFTPTSQGYTISNTGASPIDYAVTHSANWIDVSNASGTIAGGGSVGVVVSINALANGLAVGSHADTVALTNLTDGTGSTSREVRLEIGRIYASATDTPLAIPDGNNATSTHGSVASFVDPGVSGTVADLDVALRITHTFVGDLCVTLEHEGVSVDLVQRPGASTANCHFGSPYGCSSDGYDVVLDDEGAGGALESLCAGSMVSPPGYVPLEPLSAFDGLPAAGKWTLTVRDGAGADVGTLQGWTLEILIEQKSPVDILSAIRVPRGVGIKK